MGVTDFDAEVANWYRSGVGAYKIAARFGVSKASVYRVLRAMGVTVRSQPEAARSLRRDLSQERFGRLRPMRRVAGRSRSQWVCQCDCGQTVTAFQTNLVTGATRSCGCARRQHQESSHDGEVRSGHP